MVEVSLLICPVCSGHSFSMKYEAKYIYSYEIDSNAPGLKNTKDFLPYMYDNREQKETKQFLQCETCGSKYQCYLDHWDESIDMKALQNAIYTDFNSQLDYFNQIDLS